MVYIPRMIKINKETLSNGVIKITAQEGNVTVGSLFVDTTDPHEGFGPLQVNPTHRRM